MLAREGRRKNDAVVEKVSFPNLSAVEFENGRALYLFCNSNEWLLLQLRYSTPGRFNNNHSLVVVVVVVVEGFFFNK